MIIIYVFCATPKEKKKKKSENLHSKHRILQIELWPLQLKCTQDEIQVLFVAIFYQIIECKTSEQKPKLYIFDALIHVQFVISLFCSFICGCCSVQLQINLRLDQDHRRPKRAIDAISCTWNSIIRIRVRRGLMFGTLLRLRSFDLISKFTRNDDEQMKTIINKTREGTLASTHTFTTKTKWKKKKIKTRNCWHRSLILHRDKGCPKSPNKLVYHRRRRHSHTLKIRLINSFHPKIIKHKWIWNVVKVERNSENFF